MTRTTSEQSPRPRRSLASVTSLRPATVSRLLALAWLSTLWMLLWGAWSAAGLLSGVLVAAVVTTLLPLPPVRLGGTPHPRDLARFAGRFAFDLLVASWQVAWLAVRPGPPPRSSIITVPLRSDSDLVLTLVAEAVCLTPGTVVVDAQPGAGALHVHALGTRDADDVEEVRQSVIALEERVIRAVGLREDLLRVGERARDGRRRSTRSPRPGSGS